MSKAKIILIGILTIIISLFSVTARAESPLIILNTGNVLAELGDYIHIVGEVENPSDRDYSLAELEVEFLNEEGEIITSTSTYTPYIKAGGMVPFKTEAIGYSDEFNRYRIKIASDVIAAQNRDEAFEISDIGDNFEEARKYINITGEVKNLTREYIPLVEVIVTFYKRSDEDTQVIDIASAYIEDLEGEEARSFKTTSLNWEGITDYKVQAIGCDKDRAEALITHWQLGEADRVFLIPDILLRTRQQVLLLASNEVKFVHEKNYRILESRLLALQEDYRDIIEDFDNLPLPVRSEIAHVPLRDSLEILEEVISKALKGASSENQEGDLELSAELLRRCGEKLNFSATLVAISPKDTSEVIQISAPQSVSGENVWQVVKRELISNLRYSQLWTEVLKTSNISVSVSAPSSASTSTGGGGGGGGMVRFFSMPSF